MSSSNLKGVELGQSMSKSMNLKIKTTDGNGEFDISISPDEPVATLKGILTGRMTIGRDKYLRLIFNGKLLDPPEALLSSFKLSNNSYIHAVVSKKPMPTSHLASVTPSPNTQTTPQTQQANHRGLNVLLLANGRNGRPMLNIDDISALRAAFTQSIRDFTTYHQITVRPNESADDFRYRCESQWMYAQDATSEFQQNLMAYRLFGGNGLRTAVRNNNATAGAIAGGVLNGGEEGEAIFGDHDDDDDDDEEGQQQQQQGEEEEDVEEGGNFGGGPGGFAAAIQAQTANGGTAKDFMLGLFLGYFLGVLAMFCMRGNMSNKQRIGICVGVLLQGITNAFFNPKMQKNGSGGSGTHGGLRGSYGGGATMAPHGNANDDSVGIVKSIPG